MSPARMVINSSLLVSKASNKSTRWVAFRRMYAFVCQHKTIQLVFVLPIAWAYQLHSTTISRIGGGDWRNAVSRSLESDWAKRGVTALRIATVAYLVIVAFRSEEHT